MYYSFDEQVCDLQYYVSGYNVQDVDLNTESEILLEHFSENSEWSLLNIETFTHLNDGTKFVTVRFTIKRRASFIVFTVMIPLVTLSLLNICIYLVPVEQGEKGSLSITIFLAYSFLIMSARDSIPSNSLQTSYLVTCVCILLLLSAFSVLYVMVESKVHFAIGSKQCTLWKRLKTSFSWFSRSVKVGQSEKNGGNVKLDKSKNRDNPVLKKDAKPRQETYDSLSRNEKQAPKDNKLLTWDDFLRTMDTAMFLFTLIITLIMCFVLLVLFHAN